MAPPFHENDLDADAAACAPTVAAAAPLTPAAMGPRGVAPRLASVNADNASAVPGTPPMGPISPASSPRAQPHALPSLLLGLLAAALLFAGLSVFGIALAWSGAMTTFAQVALMISGGYLIAFGVAYIASRDAGATTSHA